MTAGERSKARTRSTVQPGERWMITQKNPRGRLWAAFRKDGFLQSTWERFTVKKTWDRQLLEEAAKEEQQETNGRRQKIAPYKKELELLREVRD